MVDMERHARHLVLPQVGVEGQDDGHAVPYRPYQGVSMPCQIDIVAQ